MTVEIEAEKFAEYAAEIKVYNDGTVIPYSSGTQQFGRICASWSAMIDGAHQMPAFGVSLHGETVKEMKSGVWVEFIYGQAYENSCMPFERLLIKVQTGWSGFNVIRYNTGYGYDGRCLYFDLVKKDMNAFYKTVKEINL